MDNKERQNFLAYINNPMSKESITLLYTSNNIRYENVNYIAILYNH